MPLARRPYGALPSGAEVETLVLTHASGVSAEVLTLGATLHSYAIPDAAGRIEDCLLGHDDLAGHLAHRGFFGATIGRFANRIAGGRFALGGERFVLPANDGPNTLHGGPDGFDRRNWAVVETGDTAEPFVTLELVSPDGDQGFPGRLVARVTYRLDAQGLEITLHADCDRPSPVSLTNHAFFNLGGGLDDPGRIRSAMDHMLWVPATRFLPGDAEGIPQGPPLPVAGTVFDFRAPRRIGQSVRAGEAQLVSRRGYDHCLCPDGEGMRPVAQLSDPVSGRSLRIASDCEGVQLYSGNFLDGQVTGKGGVAYRAGDAVCLEPQAFPDAPNRPDFPAALVAPGQPWQRRIRLDHSV